MTVTEPVPFLDEASEEYVSLRRTYLDQIDKNRASESRLGEDFGVALDLGGMVTMRQTYILAAAAKHHGLDVDDPETNLGALFEELLNIVAPPGTVGRAEIEVSWQQMIATSLKRATVQVEDKARTLMASKLGVKDKKLIVPGQ